MTIEANNELPDEIYYRPDGTFWLQKPDDSAIVYTRPAKAVQGDKAEDVLRAVEAAEQEHEIGTFRKEYVSLKDLLLPSEIACIKSALSALTPESEGIAGKGDALADLAYLKEVDFHSRPSMPKDTLERYARIETALSTRPQEIDIEALKWSTALAVGYADMSGAEMVILGKTIDHLAASGYLSKAKE